MNRIDEQLRDLVDTYRERTDPPPPELLATILEEARHPRRWRRPRQAVAGRARSRPPHRRRPPTAGLVLAAFAVLAVCLVAFGLARAERNDTVVIDHPPNTTGTTTPELDYGFAPFTPLVDAPLPEVAPTDVGQVDDYRLVVSSAPGALTVMLTNDHGGGGDTWDPLTQPAISWHNLGVGSETDAETLFIFGATRAEVARVVVETPDGAFQVDTLRSPAFPQLSFFVVKSPTSAESKNTHFHLARVLAYADDGTRLTDTDRIERESFPEGTIGEEEDAVLIDVRVEPDQQSITVRAFNCGGDLGLLDLRSDETTVTIRLGVLWPTAEGPCLAGESGELNIDLGEPLGDRTIIDGRTGSPAALRAS